ncbi:hypothetical protein GOV09_04700 [Candidatus Woesearchaeota archaeon]|nr:hypothetical protein [Candidatus Woesearchaeota archaeon]
MEKKEYFKYGALRGRLLYPTLYVFYVIIDILADIRFIPMFFQAPFRIIYVVSTGLWKCTGSYCPFLAIILGAIITFFLGYLIGGFIGFMLEKFPDKILSPWFRTMWVVMVLLLYIVFTFSLLLL